MANGRDIKRRILSVKNTQQITKAMKMVSAAKLMKAQKIAQLSKEYCEAICQLSKNITQVIDPEKLPALAVTRKLKKVGIILITSNRGLAGSFNSSLIKYTLDYIKRYKDIQVEVIAVGNKGAQALIQKGVTVKKQFNELEDIPKYSQVDTIAQYAVKKYLAGTYDQIDIIYEAFISSGEQISSSRQLLPITLERDSQHVPNEYIYESGPENILELVLPKYINVLVYQVVMETKASEHLLRMTSMSIATDNADTMIDKLILNYNRSRQGVITREISEIVGGVKALKKKALGEKKYNDIANEVNEEVCTFEG